MLVGRLGVLLVAAVLATATACSGSVDQNDIRSAEGSLTGITVSGEPGTAPVVRIAAPLEVSDTRSQTVVRGSGPPVVVDQTIVLQLTIHDARTGKKAISTYDPGQRAMAVKDTDGTLFPVLSDALAGLRQGSRLVMAIAPEDGYGEAGAPQYGIEAGDALVLVADVVSVAPSDVLDEVDGEATPGATGPRVVLEDGAPARVDTAGTPKPGDLRVLHVVRGDGPRIRDDSLVTIHSLAQVWGEQDPFDDNFRKEPALVPIGTGTVVAAWDKALVGVPRGSRVVIVAPPRLAFGADGNPPSVPGNATIVYVIDVLGVS